MSNENDFQNTTQQPNRQTANVLNMTNRTKTIIGVSIGIIVFIILLIAFNGGNAKNNGIKVMEEELVTDVRYAVIGNNLYPILLIKVKNESSVTKKVSFEANFYADGNLLGSDQASFVTLAPGDEAILKAQSDTGYKAWTSYEYTYKITKWHIYNQ